MKYLKYLIIYLSSWFKGSRIRGIRNIEFGDFFFSIPHHATIEAQKKSSIKIGKKFDLHPYAILSTRGGFIEIGDNCSVNEFCVLYGHGGLKIGNGVRIATHSVIIPANHNYSDINKEIRLQGETKKGIEIKDDVWIGARVTILDGVTIGNGCVIGAGSVVTKSIPPYSVAVGVPAKVVRNRALMQEESQ